MDRDMVDQGDCQVAEIVQYICDVRTSTSSDPEIICYPIPRFFQMCPGKPVLEVTKFAEVDPRTGEVKLPTSSRIHVEGKDWTKVTRCRTGDSDLSVLTPVQTDEERCRLADPAEAHVGERKG